MFDSPDSEPIFERLVDREQAVELIKIHPKTLQRYARADIMFGVRVGKLWRFHSSELLASICGEERDLDDAAQSRYAEGSYPCRLTTVNTENT